MLREAPPAAQPLLPRSQLVQILTGPVRDILRVFRVPGEEHGQYVGLAAVALAYQAADVVDFQVAASVIVAALLPDDLS